jgi:hypothetical protein
MALRRVFVGRDRELDNVASAFEDALGGRGSLFLLVGSAGIGKTRLADELARKAEEGGLQAFWGRCWETGGAPAYWPWMQILRELARERSPAELRAAAGVGAGAVAHLAPELSAPGDALPADPDPAQARFRLFDAVTAVLRAAARTRPLFLVLDDLHTADPSSLALLHFLARNLRGLRVLVVGTYRDEEARLSPPVGQLLGDIAREGTYLPLAPLSTAEIAEVVSHFTGKPADTDLLASVERASEGNPLFLDELLRLLLQRGEAGPMSGAMGHAGPLPIPDTVREVIRRRLERLPADARELLAVGSVMGRDVALGTLVALAGGSAAETVARLEPATAANLLIPAESGSYRFSHVLVRETLYRDLAANRRADMHLQIATLLEARGDEALAEVAHHRLAALPAGDLHSTIRASRQAADRAMAMLAFEDAATLLEQTRAGLEGVGSLAARDAFELRLGAGLAFMRAGQGDRGRGLCAAAAAEARRMGDGERLAQAALGYGAEVMLAQTDPTLIALLEEALMALPPGPSGTRAQAMARLAAARMPAEDIGPPMAQAREAVAMARACNATPDILRKVLYSAGSALADYGDPAERVSYSEELVALARAAGDKVQMLRGECRLVFDYLELGEFEMSKRAVDTYESLAREFRQARHIWPAHMMRAMFATVQGRAADARRFVEEARTLAAADRDMATATVFAWHGVAQVLAFDRTEEATRALTEITQAIRIPGYERIAQGMIDVCRVMLLGRFSDDTAEIKHTLDALPWGSPFLSSEFPIVACMAEPVAVVGDANQAQRLYDIVKPHAHRFGSWGRSGFTCVGPLDTFVALLAGTMRNYDECVERLERSVSRCDLAGFRLPATEARYWQARFLAERRGPGDIERARERLAETESIASSLNLRRLAERVARVRATLGAPIHTVAPKAVRPSSGPRSFTLAREGEYWTVSADGATARVRDSRGVQMLDELVTHPGREFHVLVLMGSSGAELDGGDAGEVLDEEAIAEYRERLTSLEEELAEAKSWADPGRAERARAERDAIAQELARGVGLGGRGRRAGAAAERARVNVQRRIRGAIRKIGESLPELAAYLDRAVRTGAFCAYEPF